MILVLRTRMLKKPYLCPLETADASFLTLISGEAAYRRARGSRRGESKRSFINRV